MDATFYIIILFLILILIFSGFIKYLGIYKRKYNYLYLKEILDNHKEKITNSDDLEYLTISLEKLKNYYIKWWLNLTPNFAFRQKKINKIINKYNIIIWKIK